MSGSFKISDDIPDTFEEMKIRKKYHYIVMKLNEERESIDIEYTRESDAESE